MDPVENATIRQLQALLEAQTSLRRVAEEQARAARAALDRIAEGLCPQELDELRRQTPAGLGTLEPRTIADLVLRIVRRRLGTLEAVAGSVDAEEVLALREEVGRLQAELKRRSAPPVRPAPATPKPVAAASTKPKPARVKSKPAAAKREKKPAPQPARAQPAAPQASEHRAAPPWQRPASPPPSEPASPFETWPGWAQRWREESGKFKRDVDVVIVLGDTGVVRREDVGEVLAEWWDVTPKSGGINRALSRVRDEGLVEAIPSRREENRYPQHLLRLTERGRDAYRLLRGEDPIPSQTTELLRRHKSPEHAILNLEAAIGLWESGYVVELFPDKVELEGGTYYPDLVAQLDGQILYVECERSTHKKREERERKWELYYRATAGHFAVVTPTEEAGKTILAEIRSWAKKNDRTLTIWLTFVEGRQTKGLEWLEY